MANNPPISFQALMSLPSLDDQRDYLQSAGQLNEGGLELLLDGAAETITSNIDTAAQLATIVRQLAPELNAEKLTPRATYLLAQTETIRGRHSDALDLITAAHNQYIAQNDPLSAWRTVVGRMNVLGQLGRYDEALSIGQQTRAEITEHPDADGNELRQITCFIIINEGICQHEAGNYEASVERYETATQLSSFIPRSTQIRLQNNYGNVLTTLGRFNEALTVALASSEEWNDAPDQVKIQHLHSLGSLHLQMGAYLDSLNILTEARQIADRLPETVQTYTVWLNSAESWLALNLFPEALDGYRRAQVGLEKLKMPYHLARAWRGIGAILSATNEYAEAESALRASSKLFDSIGNAPQQASALIELAGSLLEQGRVDEALPIAQEAAALAQQEDALTTQFFAQIRLADLMLATNDYTAAATHLQRAQTAIETLPLPHLLWILRYQEGVLARAQGDDESAVQSLQTAIEAIEQLRGTLPQETLRTSFLSNKTDVYAELIDLYLAQDALPEAFAMAEQAKARTLVDLMVGAVNDRLTSSDSSSDAEQLRALKRDLNALYNQLLTDESDTRGTRQTIQNRAVALEQSIRHLHLKTTTADTQLLHSALPFATLSDQLSADVPIVAYHIINDEILAFVYNGANESPFRVVRDLGSQRTILSLLNKLNQRWNRLKLVHDIITPNELHRHEKSAQRILHTLYEHLFAPLRPYLSTQQHESHPLVIVPHGILHALPFHALYDGERYLIDEYAMSYAPSVSVFALCQQQTIRPLKQAHLIGIDDPTITHVAAEIGAVATQFPHAAVYTEAQANQAAFEQITETTDLLHIASHGLFRADNPMFSALKLADGWLTANDIMQLPYIPPVVTLSACESGRGHVVAGDELLGLTRAFMGRGATTLIASLWLVQDEIAAELMPIFYEQITTLPTKTAALRHAQLTIREQYPHPWYWATFQLIGQR